MALTQKQVSELYVAIFNRASEGKGNKYWQTKEATSAATADAMLATTDAKTYFGTSLDSNEAFIKHIYLNTLNKTDAQDKAGVDYWVSLLNAGTSRGEVVAKIVYAVSTYKDSTDPVTKAAYDQFNNRVDVSNYMANTVETPPADYKTSTAFATSGTTGLVVTNSASTVTTAKTSVDALKPVDGTTFTLTTGTDTFAGTAKSDLFNATALNTLNKDDVLVDSTTTDSDILNATVTTDNVSARIQNIETINVTGEYVKTGLALTNVSGTKTLNLDTKLAGGTATVTDANSINAAAIKAGANISTLNVNSLSSGTRDTVTVDGGNADVNLTGNTGGADKYSVTVAKDKTLTLTTLDSSGDVVTANSAANFKLSNATATPVNLKVVVNNTSANAITVSTDDTDLLAKTVELTGGAVTLKGDDAAFAGVEVTSSATKSTIELSATAIGAVTGGLNKAQVSEVLISGAGTLGITVNENSKLVLAKDQTTAVVADIDNAKGDMLANSKTGTLLLDVNASQATGSVATGANVDTVLLTAGKLANDANGKAQTVTITDFITNNATDTIVVNGANDLVITKLSSGDADTVVATAHTGKLTINDFTANTKVFSGSNDDTFKVAAPNAVVVLQISSGAGNDTVDLSNSTAANKINLGEGDDTVTTGAGANDITLGAGKDTVIIASTKDGAIIADAVIGEDKIILTGTANNGAALNVAALGTITAGSYAAFGANHAFTLTGSTASDLSGLVQFGKQAVAATATTAAVAEVVYTAAAQNLTTGSFNDVVVTGATGNINLGAGDDKITTAATYTGTITGGAGSDTFVISNTTAGTATIADLGATDILQVTGTATVNVVESFTATAATTNAATTTTLNLKDGVNVDMTLATLTASANGYTITTDAAVTKGATIVGSRGDDTITGSKFADTITGGEGQDTITAGAGADTIILTESVSAKDVVILGSVTAAGIDTIVGFNAGTNVIGGQVDTIKTSAAANTAALALTDKGTLDKATYATLDAAIATFATGGANATTALNAYTFKYDSKDYLLIDNGTNGYDAATDSVVEITGLVGNLDVTDILNA